MTDNELQHYGILGMKWGVRRYQNYDGSLTPAGRKRYWTNAGLEDRGGESTGNSSGSDSTRSSQSSSSQSTSSRPSTKMPAASELTTKELDEFLRRVDLEKKYNAIVNPPEPKKEESPAIKFIKDVLTTSARNVATQWVTDVLRNLVYKNQNKNNQNQNQNQSNQNQNQNNQKKDNTKERLDSIDKLLKDIQTKINSQPSSSSKKSEPTSNYWMNDSKAINETLDALLNEVKYK